MKSKQLLKLTFLIPIIYKKTKEGSISSCSRADGVKYADFIELSQYLLALYKFLFSFKDVKIMKNTKHF